MITMLQGYKGEICLDEYLYTYSSQLIQQYNEQMEQIIKNKLRRLANKAFKNGEYKLAFILNELKSNNLEQVKNELEKSGYSIELETPQTHFDFKESVVKAFINTDEIKIKVKKLIIEV